MATNKKITELPAATLPILGSGSRIELVQGGINVQTDPDNIGGGGTSIPFGSTTGTNSYSATMSPVVAAYAEGAMYHIRVGNSSTSTVTFDLGPGAKKAFVTDGSQAQGGHFLAGVDYLVTYKSSLDSGAGGFLVVNELVHGLMNVRGTYTSGSSGLYPASGGSGPAAAIRHGDAFVMADSDTLGTRLVEIGDLVFTGVDAPGQTEANWYIIPGFNSLALKTDQLTSFRRPTASHTLDSTDLAAINAGDDVVIEMNVASANDLTVPLNATVAFPVGTKITGIQYGVGQTSIVAAGGVTIHTSSGDFLARAQYAPFMLEKVATDEWYLSNGTTPGAVISSGTYTPSLTNTTNVAASTAYACQYLRIGATVTVSGKVSIDPTAAGDTVLGMSIPIASAFSQEFHAGGVAAAYAVAGLSAAILADATNDRFTFRFTAVDTANRDFFFSATYQII